jgi:CheY-like chemotaxis protein
MSKSSSPPTKSLKVLVVEDDLASLELIYEVLVSLDVEVFPASDSERALTVAQNEKFDGIFVDLHMPRIDGFKLMKAIRSNGWNQRTPVIVLTGMGDRDTMQRAFAAGATFFLRKPVDRRQLTSLLNSTRGTMLINRRRFRRVPFNAEVTVIFGSVAREVRSLDLSESGMLVEGLNVDVGKAVQLSFRLRNQGSLISVQASVKRVDKGSTGMLFQDVKGSHQQLLRDFIDAQETPPVAQRPTKAS